MSISFDKSKAQPGDSVNVHVSADPMSFINLLAVDQSVLLLKSQNDITRDKVSELRFTYINRSVLRKSLIASTLYAHVGL